MKVLFTLLFVSLLAFAQTPATQTPTTPAAQASAPTADAGSPPSALAEATLLKTQAERSEIQSRYRLKIEQEMAPIQAKYEAQANKELEAVAAEEAQIAGEECKAKEIDIKECRIDPGKKDASGKQVGRVWREVKPATQPATASVPAAAPPDKLAR
jgi:hypothetical protein